MTKQMPKVARESFRRAANQMEQAAALIDIGVRTMYEGTQDGVFFWLDLEARNFECVAEQLRSRVEVLRRAAVRPDVLLHGFKTTADTAKGGAS